MAGSSWAASPSLEVQDVDQRGLAGGPVEGEARTAAAACPRFALDELRVLPELQAPDLTAVHLVRPVREAERPRVSPHERQRELLADAAAAVDLHGPVEDLERRVRDRDLDLGNGLLGGL